MFASSSSPMVLGLPINLPKLQLSVLISYLFYIQQCVYARRSNQSILKEISPGYSLEGLMLKLKLQYFGQFMRRTDSLKNTLMLGNEGRKRKG